jgi:hypothetical protein
MSILSKIFGREVNSFELKKDLSAADLHEMIKNDNFPSFVTPLCRQRIKELYERGNTWDAVRNLKTLIDNHWDKRDKALL